MSKKIKNMLLLELGIIFLVLIIFIIIKLNLIKYIPACFIKENLGFLCPSCGGTRCVINFIQGNFKASFLYHPIFFITIIYLFIVNILYIFNTLTNAKIAIFLYLTTKFWIMFIVVLLLYTVIRNF